MGITTLELAPAPRRLGLPPGSVPVDAVRTTIRRYQAGIGTDEQLIASIDRHGDALEREIARKAVQHLRELHQAIARADVLAGYVSTRLAQLEWLESFPAGPGVEAVPLSCPVRDGHVEVPEVLEALRAVRLPARVLWLGSGERRVDGRRGASASLAALADAGVSVTDVALEVGVSRSRAWAMLSGHQPVRPELWPALARLAGWQIAERVRAGIPDLPRARGRASPAVRALHDAGATAGDVAELIPVQPGTVRAWLRGTLRPPPRLAVALEQLVGAATAARIVALIPPSR